MTTNEYLKIFGQELAEEHIKKLKQENGVGDIDVDQFIINTELFLERMKKLNK